MIEWGFQHLPVTKLVGIVKPENDGSRRVLEKAKMRYRGRAQYSNVDVAVYEIQKELIK